MPYPASRHVRLTWLPLPGADGYVIERKLAADSDFATLDIVTTSPYLDLNVPNGTYNYRMTAFAGGDTLAQKTKTIEVLDLEDMPIPVSLRFDIINVSGFSLDWDTGGDPNFWSLTGWRQRDWTFGDPALPRWTADVAHAPTLSFAFGNENYFGTGYPALLFGNSALDSLAVPDYYMEMADPPAAFEPPCSVLMQFARTYNNNTNPRCLLQLGKLALYSSTGAGQFLGLRVAGGFVTTGLNIAAQNYLVAVIARSETDIDFYRIQPGTGTWASELGVSGGAWENHGEFSLGSMLTAPYHRNRFTTCGFVAWRFALSTLELERAVSSLTNANNLHFS